MMYAGPIKWKTYHQRGIGVCIQCHTVLSEENKANGRWWCDACADPEGYTERLRTAEAEARQRTLERYPVCKLCGRRLSAAQVRAGQNTHEQDHRLCVAPTGELSRAQEPS